MNYILDTNIVSAILKLNPKILDKLDLLDVKYELFISIITYYEIERGLISVNATTQLKKFEDFCQKHKILELSDIAVPPVMGDTRNLVS